jgi:lipopolysaccharide biosynthesis protein
MNKHAIIVHLYYNDLWDEFYSKLKPIIENCSVDLYVTLTEDDTSELENVNKVTNNVFVLPNKGLDVGPFLYILDLIKDREYTAITKFHSKKSLHHGQPKEFGEIWRLKSYQPLVENVETYKELTGIIEDNPLSMIGTERSYWDFTKDRFNISVHYPTIKGTLSKLQIQLMETPIDNTFLFGRNGGFFSGTMFMTSHKYLKQLFEKTNMKELYDNLPTGYVRDSDSHSLERIFGFYMESIGGELLIAEDKMRKA